MADEDLQLIEGGIRIIGTRSQSGNGRKPISIKLKSAAPKARGRGKKGGAARTPKAKKPIKMEAEPESEEEIPLETYISKPSGQPEPTHQNQQLRWNYKVNLLGEKVIDPLLHCCEKCSLPILIYGRMIPCKHVFCLDCAKKMDKKCPRCQDPVERIEQSALGTVFMCMHGGAKHSMDGCRRTYLSLRDLHAHVNHRHQKTPSAEKPKIKTEVNVGSVQPASVSQNPPLDVMKSMPPPNQIRQQRLPQPENIGYTPTPLDDLKIGHPPPTVPVPRQQPPMQQPPLQAMMAHPSLQQPPTGVAQLAPHLQRQPQQTSPRALPPPQGLPPNLPRHHIPSHPPPHMVPSQQPPQHQPASIPQQHVHPVSAPPNLSTIPVVSAARTNLITVQLHDEAEYRRSEPMASYMTSIGSQPPPQAAIACPQIPPPMAIRQPPPQQHQNFSQPPPSRPAVFTAAMGSVPMQSAPVAYSTVSGTGPVRHNIPPASHPGPMTGLPPPMVQHPGAPPVMAVVPPQTGHPIAGPPPRLTSPQPVVQQQPVLQQQPPRRFPSGPFEEHPMTPPYTPPPGSPAIGHWNRGPPPALPQSVPRPQGPPAIRQGVPPTHPQGAPPPVRPQGAPPPQRPQGEPAHYTQYY